MQRVRQSDQPAFAVDEDNHILAWNRGAAEMVGVPIQRALRKNLPDVLEARDLFGNRMCPDFCGLHQMVRRGEAVVGFTLELPCESGSSNRVVTSVEVVPGPKSSSYHLLFLLRPDRRRKQLIVYQQAPSREEWQPAEVSPDLETRVVDLTPRQLEVLQQLSNGRSTKEVAACLNISVHTVRNHIQNALGKLHAHGQVEAVAEVLRRNLI
ncbi:MAG: LuxR C-terminal-related transcriptional regulator [Thermoanaerobaculia bacterium]